MSQFLDDMIAQAKADKKTIVLPEGNDIRTLKAARSVVDQGIADVIVLGTPEEIAAHGVDLAGITTIDPASAADRDELAAALAERRKNKGMTVEKAQELLNDVLYYGTMMIYCGKADGMVTGAVHATGDVLRPALQIIKTAPGVKNVSSAFVMIVPDCELGDHGRFVFADCAVNDDPDAEKLAQIAVASAATFKALLGDEPRVAMLSYSSYGSAKGHLVDKVQEATRMAKEAAPELQLDGELQLDAAIVPEVGALKAPSSPVAGKANVLVFPSLEAANIGYKLVQRLGKAEAYGPVTQGLAAPVNDLSRGCSAEDIVGVVAITCIQAQAMARA
ncbi:MAG: phosphate acetyltransferase [Coriobacteriales bacterium]|nr:phosphate acetyltransferase [Coriobacteriales bacterium]